MKKLRHVFKYLAFFVIFNLLYEMLFPVVAYALTGGPSQPETESFQPIEITDLVDPFTGSFSYSIPLFDIGGYPINLSYQSGVGMDDEASWVGLGWNINPGVINRSMRGLPDDFKGDKVKQEMSTEPNISWNIGGSVSLELLGSDLKFLKGGINIPVNVMYNNYRGLGFSLGANLHVSGGNMINVEGGLGFNSMSGMSLDGKIGFDLVMNEEIDGQATGGFQKLGSANVGSAYNSRAGLQQLSFNAELKRPASSSTVRGKKGNYTFTRNRDINARIPIGTQSYTPPSGFEYKNISFNLKASAGAEIIANFPAISLFGGYSRQELVTKVKTQNAYGYMYTHIGKAGENAKRGLYDFNREKDAPYQKEIKNLPLSQMTYDLFNVSGQGVGGMFRPHSNYLSIMHDPLVYNKGLDGIDLGLEAGVGNIVRMGFDIKPQIATSYKGPWQEGNIAGMVSDMSNKIAEHMPINSFYEPVFFKFGGEMAPVDESDYANIGKHYPVKIPIEKVSNTNAKTDNTLLYRHLNSTKHNTIPHLRLGERAVRSQNITVFTAKEASIPGVGFMSKLKNYPLNESPGNVFPDLINRYEANKADPNYNSSRKAHHISEIIVTKPDGMRYVYSIPAYNSYQKETSFSVDHNKSDMNLGLVKYTPDLDNTINNPQGLDKFYQAQHLPAYAHSYLLTGILSPDYKDLQGSGISRDDIGAAVQFNYTMTSSNYQWRTPYEKDSASYNPGFVSNKLDDKGSYVYGIKELWYLNSLESNTHIAEFKISPRNDGFGVENENGGIGISNDNRMMKLDSIIIYSRIDKMLHGINAVPVKKIVFEYEYSLCPGVPNNDNSDSQNTGKLTLKKLYILHGNSEKGRLSPYVFNYRETDPNYNPEYNRARYDRWGNFKLPDDQLHNQIYPYVNQEEDMAEKVDQYVAAWSLHEIRLPSGGVIKVDYESHDYAYVQDKRAMQMVRLLGASQSPGLSTLQNVSKLYEGSSNNLYLHFLLPYSVNSAEEFRQRYLEGIEDMYFNFKVNINKNNDSQKEAYDYVNGYSKIDIQQSGIISDKIAYVKLKAVHQGDPKGNGAMANPISKRTWHFGRNYFPQLVYPGSSPNQTDESALKGLLNSFGEIKTMFTGPNKAFRDKEFGKFFIPDKSWIRVNNPNYAKKGGGARVKTLLIGDNWEEMDVSHTTMYHGQSFDYTMYDREIGEKISSGVAQYEPMIGNEENPWRQPVYYTVHKRGYPDEPLYHEAPFGETFFPSASVGYRKVTVRNIKNEQGDEIPVGKRVHEFYTAFDFPVKTAQTRLEQVESPKVTLFGFLNIKHEQFVATSQGYSVELNDMHGKPKRLAVYSGNTMDDGGAKLLSETIYRYQTKGRGILDNTVKTLNYKGEVIEKEIGIDYDVFLDINEAYNKDDILGVQINIDNFILPIFPPLPLSIVVPLPKYSASLNRYQSATVTKVIQRYGILKEMEQMENSSRVVVENQIYDAVSGAVLLTRSNNEYNDPLFEFNYPAYHAYENMGPAYKNDGVILNLEHNHILESGWILAGKDLMAIGDKVLIEPEMKLFNAVSWVLDKRPAYMDYDSVLLINRTGNNFDNYTDRPVVYGIGHKLASAKLKIIESGRRNQLSHELGNVSMLKSPINGSQLLLDSTSKIVNSSVQLYSDKWRLKPDRAVFGGNKCDTIIDPAFEDFTNMLYHLHEAGILFASTNTTYNLNNWIGFNQTALYDFMLEIYKTKDSSATSLDSVLIFVTHGPEITDAYDSDKKNIISYSFGLGGYSNGIQWSVFCCDLKIDLALSIPDRNHWGKYISMTDITQILSIEYFYEDPPLYFSACKDTFLTHKIKLEVLIEKDNKKYYTTLTIDLTEECPLAKIVCNSEFEICDYQIGKPLNPFLNNIRNRWRPSQSYHYIQDREYLHGLEKTYIRSDGLIKSYTPFWQYTSSGLIADTIGNFRWIPSQRMLNYESDGMLVEAKNAINIYSAELYGYEKNLVTAVAQNAKHRQIGFDHFEDYDMPFIGCKQYAHWNFMLTPYDKECKGQYLVSVFNTDSVYIDDEISHTGLRSLCLLPGADHYNEREIDLDPEVITVNDDLFRITDIADLITPFSPDTGFIYVISGWLMEQLPNLDTTYTYHNAHVVVHLLDNQKDLIESFPLYGKGPIIEGWQRFAEEFYIPYGAKFIKTELVNSSQNYKANFDDIRIHPFNAGMQTYVYHPVHLKVMAILDENNFATIYEYDDEGVLIRVKKETERGIVTIREARRSIIKSNP